MKAVSVILSFAICLFCPNTHAQLNGNNRPDIVVFITDDQSQVDTSLYGNQVVRTPNLDKLASEGMTFSHAFVASPSCAPSRAALLTGLMPARNGAEANHTDPRPEIRKLPAYFHELGYEVVAFGKVAHGAAEVYGFDEAATEGWIWKGGIKHAVEYLEERESSKPLLMFVGTFAPHQPWPENSTYELDQVVPPPFHVDSDETRKARAKYYTAISEADRKMAVIRQLSREKLDNPLFIFTSDHGGQWPFGKWSLYDYGIRVPFVASWPGIIEEGSRSEAMISWVDILPTLLEIAGGETPANIDGRSFAKVLKNPGLTHREKIFTTHSADGGSKVNAYPIRSVRDRNWKYIRNLNPELSHHSFEDRHPTGGEGYWNSWEKNAEKNPGDAAIVKRYHWRPAEELYNLENDPHELSNLASDPAYGDRLSSMRAELDAWMEAQGDQKTLYTETLGPWHTRLLINTLF